VPHVWTDRVAVVAVLDNLLSNAVKYSPPRHAYLGPRPGRPDQRALQCPGRRSWLEPRGASATVSARRAPQSCPHGRGALHGLWLGSGQGASRTVGWGYLVCQQAGTRGVFLVSSAGIPRTGV
jgi:hypothetical protein